MSEDKKCKLPHEKLGKNIYNNNHLFLNLKKIIEFIQHLPVPSAEDICKQSKSGLTKCRARSGSKLFATLIVVLKDFFEKN